MGEIVDINEYRKKKEEEAEAKKDEKITEAFIRHAEDLETR